MAFRTWPETLCVAAYTKFPQKWRPFCNRFEKEVEDFSMATLVRIDSADEYSEQNSILVTRIQFFCIEIARNKEGNNNQVRNLRKKS